MPFCTDDLITGKDRSYDRSIYVVEDVNIEQTVAFCWRIHYNEDFYHRNHKTNKRLIPIDLSEMRFLSGQDYPPFVYQKIIEIQGEAGPCLRSTSVRRSLEPSG